LIESLQTVILRGESTLGSGVDNHQYFAFKLRKVYLAPFVVKGLEIINLFHFITA
jgi:hypothetical protein